MFQPPQSIDFPLEEMLILEYWSEVKPLEISLEQSKDKPKYGFYDGPPFATGMPHYGHILAGTIKDIITRFAHQNGFHVDRRFGWDCHGLPIEYEIDKLLDIKSPEQVLEMGIDKYNHHCRSIAMKYSNEWRYCINRLGRWIDFDNDYKTLYPWFMESVWWVFKQLYNKGLIYRGFKVMPFSTACHTPISNFESGLNYKDVNDPAITISFPLIETSLNDKIKGEMIKVVSLLAWTTTPWTLISNCFLCVNPNLVYVKVLDETSGKMYILGESRLPTFFKPGKYKILDKFTGDHLKGKFYVPLFPYYAHLKKRGFFQILNDTYVTEDAGTGIVQQAPYFGEDDHRVAIEGGLISKDDEDIVCPVDDSGKYTDFITDFKGMYVKDADKLIIKRLKDDGRLFLQATVNHTYPFCWRSDTPLIYKAVPSWFVRVERFKHLLLENNAQTYWVPNFVKEKRFANWLREARDWAISRNRYWGTPIPLWISDDGQETYCVGSISELESITGKSFKDIHRENVDSIHIPSLRVGHPPLKRVNDVFDCWFESGSMPYAQQHMPFFISEAYFQNHFFPADFIAEGIDQTRGWFYTLLVLSTLLFGQPPFKNLIANGLVLASDGQKMSKRKKNYPDPMHLIDKYGADALRLYLINSPVVRGEFLKFKEEHVFDILKEAFLPWYNAYRFLVQNIELWQKCTGLTYTFSDGNSEFKVSNNIMDLWILSYTNSLIQYFYTEMEKYHLFTVVPKLMKFIDNLTNWYVRFNRKRLKGENGDEDCKLALDTLFTVIFSLCRMMAPFTPFLTEYMYQNLRKVIQTEQGERTLSIHHLMLPKTNLKMINKDIEKSVECMQTVIELGRLIRDRKNMPIKYPLNEVVIIHDDPDFEKEILSLRQYVIQELNIKKVTLSRDKTAYGVGMRAEPDHKLLGAKYKTQFKALANAVKAMTETDIIKLQKEGSIELIPNCHIVPNEIRILYSFHSNGNSDSKMASNIENKYEASSQGDLLILLDISPDADMLKEGYAREVVNRIQKLRKRANLLPLDEVTIHYMLIKDDPLINMADILNTESKHLEFITDAIKRDFKPIDEYANSEKERIIIEETVHIKGCSLHLAIVGPSNLIAKDISKDTKLESVTPDIPKNITNGCLNISNSNLDEKETLQQPYVKYFNVLFCIYSAKQKRYDYDIIDKAVILTSRTLTKDRIEKNIRTIANSWGHKLDIFFFFPNIPQNSLARINPKSLYSELNSSVLTQIFPENINKASTFSIVPWAFMYDDILKALSEEIKHKCLGNILVCSKSINSDASHIKRVSGDISEKVIGVQSLLVEAKSPLCQFVNIHLNGGDLKDVNRKYTLLRENPKGVATLSNHYLDEKRFINDILCNITGLGPEKLSLRKNEEENIYVLKNLNQLNVDLSHKLLNVDYMS